MISNRANFGTLGEIVIDTPKKYNTINFEKTHFLKIEQVHKYCILNQ